MSTNKTSAWIPDIYNYSKIFSDLELILARHNINQWPDCQLLMSFIEDKLCSHAGVPIQMIEQDHHLPYPEMSYEERIYKKGLVSTREENWHDSGIVSPDQKIT